MRPASTRRQPTPSSSPSCALRIATQVGASRTSTTMPPVSARPACRSTPGATPAGRRTTTRHLPVRPACSATVFPMESGTAPTAPRTLSPTPSGWSATVGGGNSAVNSGEQVPGQYVLSSLSALTRDSLRRVLQSAGLPRQSPGLHHWVPDDHTHQRHEGLAVGSGCQRLLDVQQHPDAERSSVPDRRLP